ncbi:hypothetical protein DPMN_159530 [Dreissena polymorpha]|uniref:Beta-lactamase-related domain-containing protein n=1 Tax=Dreissena polymorpha TaxID=45954 RepID=A0A9D4EKT7_DREPO|nr:hypothetical protein DPMN_159530 [Dreissena polymorpha]
MTCIAVLALLLVLTSMESETRELTSSELDALNNFIETTVACNSIPGLSVALVRNDMTVLARGYGFDDIEGNRKSTADSAFCIGSLTKAFTSTVIADVLSRHGRVTWDTPIYDILGATFRLSDDLLTRETTLRDLLAHKVGTPSYFHALLVGFDANMTRADLVKKLQYMPAVAPFRTQFHYSNFMYMLAGHVIETLAGETWEDLVTKRLLSKLGMRSTGFVDASDGIENVSTPYVLKNGTLVPVDKRLLLTVSPSGPAGSIYSTANDMTKWMIFHLNKGRTKHEYTPIVHPDWLETTYESQMTHPFEAKDLTRPLYPVSDASVSYNMGWVSSLYRGYRKLWHSGGIVTFSSQLWLYPDMRSGVFVASNGPLTSKGSTAIRNIAYFASDLLLGEEPWLNTSTTCSFPAPWKELQHQSLAIEIPRYKWNITRKMADYTGVYGHKGFGHIEIVVLDRNSLILRYGRFGKMKIFPQDEQVFYGYYVDELWFLTNADGRTDYMDIRFELTDGKVTALKLHIDLDSDQPNMTVFLKGGEYDSKALSKRNGINTSYSCCSGKNEHTKSSLFIYICIFAIILISRT